MSRQPARMRPKTHPLWTDLAEDRAQGPQIRPPEGGPGQAPNGKNVADVKGVKRLKKGITLKKLPNGTYKISVVATTVLDQHLAGSQT
jgi:hypothetical protein